MIHVTPTLDQMIVARSLIEHPDSWTQRVYARDAQGNDISPSNDKAVCYCSLGAIVHSVGIDIDSIWGLSPEIESALIGGKDYRDFTADWNDEPERTHAEVLAGFDRVIALLREPVDPCNS